MTENRSKSHENGSKRLIFGCEARVRDAHHEGDADLRRHRLLSGHQGFGDHHHHGARAARRVAL